VVGSGSRKYAGLKARRKPPGAPERPIELELLELLSLIEEALPQGPSSARVRLRDMRYRLVGSVNASDTDVAQMLAEQDGEPVEPEDETIPSTPGEVETGNRLDRNADRPRHRR